MRGGRGVCVDACSGAAEFSSSPAPPPSCFAWSPSPAIAGADANNLVLAVRSAPELLFKNQFLRSPHRSSPENAGGGCRSSHDPRFEHSQERTEESKEAERRETRSQPPHPSGVRRAQSAARSPLGVPPRLSANGSISSQGSTWARLRDTPAERGGFSASPCGTSSDAPRAPVIVPAG